MRRGQAETKREVDQDAVEWQNLWIRKKWERGSRGGSGEVTEKEPTSGLAILSMQP